MLKKAIAAGIVLLCGFSLSAENLFDENLPTQSRKINTSVDIKPKMGFLWGYDLDNNTSGFEEIVDIDMEWEIVSYQTSETDSSDVDIGMPYGSVLFSGGHLTLKIQDESGDLSATAGAKNAEMTPILAINYERLWGKIVWDPFYFLLAANDKNYYERHTGWSFPTSNSRPRANWAHIGSRVQGWDQTTPYAITGNYDIVKNNGGAAGVGLGYIGSSTEVLFLTTSPLSYRPKDGFPANEDNKYDFSLSMESNPVGNLMIQASALSGVNYDILPLAFSAAFGYRFDITNTIAIQPHTAMDLQFIGTESNPTDSYQTENSFGFDVIWPGTQGWGDNPLLDQEYNIFAGLTVDGAIVTEKDKDPRMNMAISMHEDGAGGLVPNLGTTLVYEWFALESDKPLNTYGVYVDYNIWNQFRPYTRILKFTDTSTSKISGEFGLEITVIPHSFITIMYKTPDLSKVNDNRGTVTTSVIATF